MSKEQLKEDAQRLLLANELNDSKAVLDIYNGFLFKVINEHTNPVVSQLRGEAKLVLQMVFTKLLNLRQLLNGLNYADGPNGLHNFIDPTIIASGVRNIVELASTFHTVYRSEYSEEQRDMLYKMWVIAGLKYRQRFVDQNSSPENIAKAATEAAEIDSTIQSIHQSQPYLALTEAKKALINRVIGDKDYRIKLVNGDAIKVHWQEIIQFMGFKPDLTGSLYTYLSLYAHPSNVSVFQYRNLFTAGADDHIKMAMFNVKTLTAIVSKFISDYIKLFPEVMAIFESLPILDQVVINWMLKLTTTGADTINDAMNELND
ncbi:hypothetical protein [Pedobacter jeongneungensis]|uniref:hypothetical protein n=1 Tax=Pedobacter jeongneungensis TaxID=947309 RepID=UPI000467F4EE|nr:hypothetical protein [Pedobacter jeongneungensis]